MEANLPMPKPNNSLVRGIFKMKDDVVYFLRQALLWATLFSLGVGISYLIKLK